MLMKKENKKNLEKREKSECGLKKKTCYFILFLTNSQTIGMKSVNTSLKEVQSNVLKDGEEFILKNKDKCGPKKKIQCYFSWSNTT